MNLISNQDRNLSFVSARVRFIRPHNTVSPTKNDHILNFLEENDKYGFQLTNNLVSGSMLQEAPRGKSLLESWVTTFLPE